MPGFASGICGFLAIITARIANTVIRPVAPKTNGHFLPTRSTTNMMKLAKRSAPLTSRGQAAYKRFAIGPTAPYMLREQGESGVG